MLGALVLGALSTSGVLSVLDAPGMLGSSESRSTRSARSTRRATLPGFRRISAIVKGPQEWQEHCQEQQASTLAPGLTGS